MKSSIFQFTFVYFEVNLKHSSTSILATFPLAISVLTRFIFAPLYFILVVVVIAIVFY
jgi:hypothetical protein